MRRWLFALLLVCAASALFLLIYPLAIIQPFRHQGPDELQRALLVFRLAPWLEIGVASIAALTGIWIWRTRTTRKAKSAVGLLLAVTFASAVLARINVFEKMFHPAGSPRFLAVQNGKWERDDMLIAVALNGDAHAYPIRAMGYHHVVNDFVGGVSVVATY